MQLTILQASEYAFNILENTTTLSVHSVYRKAVNLKAGNQLLTLQPRGSVLSPISMITACTEGELAELPFAARKTLSVTLKTEHTSRQDLFFLPESYLPMSIQKICIKKSARQLPWRKTQICHPICVVWSLF